MSRTPPDVDTQAAIALGCTDLVDILDELYPERCPDPDDSPAEMWMKAGERRLVNKLIHLRSIARVTRRS